VSTDGKTVEVIYYTLKESKHMNDNHHIESGQLLIKMPEKDGEHMLFETFDDTSIKRVFWATEDEVEYVETKEETR